MSVPADLNGRKRLHAPTWYESVLPVPEPLAPVVGERRVGTLVVGAGLAGLSTALALAGGGDRDVLVIDRDEPGAGASGRNGGFVFAGFSLANDALVSQCGAGQARRLHRWTRAAVEQVRGRCEAWQIEHNRQPVLLADWFHDQRALHELRARMAEQLDFELDFIDGAGMRDWVRSARYGGGLLEPGSFHFNPLAYLRALMRQLDGRGVALAGQSPARSLVRQAAGWQVTTPRARIRADRVVLASGGYELRLWPPALRAIQSIATYIVVTEPLGERLHQCLPGGAAVYDTRFAFDYYRPLPDTRLLWGGRISIADRDPRAIRRLLRRDLARVFPELADVGLEFAWGGWMSYARHQMPILTELEPGLWCALAFGGHGMATTTLAGEVLAEAMLGDRTRLQAFQPWGPSWAGAGPGRLAIQGVYWWKQLRDRLRDVFVGP
ncbi:MAG: FAD-binding oxidoreductase [Wenzhouxiangellaceae bacterium]|nr:FAD-binding oxidoreductase [Wenzhouxiangellaceae bacterium]